MNDTPAPNLPLKDSCFLSFIYLKLAMAGDMESVELIAQLIDRHMTIDWENPQFVADSEAMRGTDPVTPPVISNTELYRATVHVQSEQLAARHETIAMMKTSLQNAADEFAKGIKNANEQAKFTSALFDYIDKLSALHREMRDQLELLGADISIYAPPELPASPNLF